MVDKRNVFAIEEQPSLAEMVYERLRYAILSGELEPGAKLVQSELAELMGVSRMPVRDAIERLTREGLVERRSGNRSHVTDLSVETLEHIFDIREVLEGLAARLTCRRLSQREASQLRHLLEESTQMLEREEYQAVGQLGLDFHRHIVDYCGNDLLIDMLAQIQDHVCRYRAVSVTIPGRVRKAVEEHWELIDMLLQRDEERAERLAREHVARSRRRLIEALEARIGQEESNGQGVNVERGLAQTSIHEETPQS